MFKKLYFSKILCVCFIAALTISKQKTYGQIPNAKFDPLVVSIKTDTRGFQGPKPTEGEHVQYSVSGQSFLPDGIKVKISAEPIDFNNLDSLLSSPYSTLLASLYIDKVSEKAGRFALSVPGCKESLLTMMEDPSFEKFNEATRKLMEGVDTIALLLLVKDGTGDRVYAYYRLNKSGKDKLGPIYIRSLENIDGMYLVSCSPIASPMPLNIWNALISGKEFYTIK